MTSGLITCVCGCVNRVEYPDGQKVCKCGATVHFVPDREGMTRPQVEIPDGYTDSGQIRNPRPKFLRWVAK